jgi:hypothetical protein
MGAAMKTYAAIDATRRIGRIGLSFLILLVLTLYSFLAITSHLGLGNLLPPREEFVVHETARQGYKRFL